MECSWPHEDRRRSKTKGGTSLGDEGRERLKRTERPAVGHLDDDTDRAVDKRVMETPCSETPCAIPSGHGDNSVDARSSATVWSDKAFDQDCETVWPASDPIIPPQMIFVPALTPTSHHVDTMSDEADSLLPDFSFNNWLTEDSTEFTNVTSQSQIPFWERTVGPFGAGVFALNNGGEGMAEDGLEGPSLQDVTIKRVKWMRPHGGTAFVPGLQPVYINVQVQHVSFPHVSRLLILSARLILSEIVPVSGHPLG